MKKIISAIIILLCFCSAVSAEGIVVGTIFELSGQNSDIAQEAMNGAMLAVQKINGMKKGPKITLKVESTSNDPETVLETVNSLTKNKKLTAATGIISGTLALTAAPAFQAAEIPFLCTGAQVDGLAESVGENIFTLAVPDIRIGQLLAEYVINTIQVQNIVLIRSDLRDSTARQADSFARRFKLNKGKIMADIRITEQNTDLSFIAEKIKSLTPQQPVNSTVVQNGLEVSNFIDDGASIVTEKRDPAPAPQMVEAVVIFAPPQTSSKTLKMLQDKNLPLQVVGGTSFDTVTMQQSLEDWNGTVFYAAQACLTKEDKLVRSFVEDYSKLFGKAPVTGYSALGFDSVMLLAATAQNNAPDSAGIRSGLSKTENFAGVSGKISFQGRAAHKPLYIMQAVSGQISLAAEMD